MTEYEDRREWDFSGFALTRIVFDPSQIILLLADMSPQDTRSKLNDNSADIVFGSAFTFLKNAESATLNPQMSLSCIPLLTEILAPVRQLVAYRDAKLVLTFENGCKIEANTDYPYESWQAIGRGALSDMQMLGAWSVCPWGG